MNEDDIKLMEEEIDEMNKVLAADEIIYSSREAAWPFLLRILHDVFAGGQKGIV